MDSRVGKCYGLVGGPRGFLLDVFKVTKIAYGRMYSSDYAGYVWDNQKFYEEISEEEYCIRKMAQCTE